MAQYDRQIATAKRLIKKYGAAVPVKIRTVAEDPEKPWQTIETEQTYSANIVFLPLDNKAQASLGLMDNTEIPKGACIAYMGAVNFPMDLQAKIEFDGKTWELFYMDVLRPNGRIILHTMVLGS